jgi:GNAT superfamily N-acetyltransferase
MPATSGSVHIREITPADADVAGQLTAELGYPVDSATLRARIASLTAAGHGVFVACHAERVIGWIHVSAVQHMQSEPRAEIGGLVVAADARGEGVGALLVKRAEQWARDHGLGSVLVRSQVMREAAHRFYLREGYVRTKTSAVFSKMLSPQT